MLTLTTTRRQQREQAAAAAAAKEFEGGKTLYRVAGIIAQDVEQFLVEWAGIPVIKNTWE
jgi:hypothetical protein